MDKPIAALIKDLKQRGMLDDTLIICGGEFGRTPFREGRTASSKLLGRDHFPDCYSMWLAGGGIKPGCLTASRTSSAFRSPATKSTSTICKPRSCTCWASTTRNWSIGFRGATIG